MVFDREGNIVDYPEIDNEKKEVISINEISENDKFSIREKHIKDFKNDYTLAVPEDIDYFLDNEEKQSNLIGYVEDILGREVTSEEWDNLVDIFKEDLKEFYGLGKNPDGEIERLRNQLEKYEDE